MKKLLQKIICQISCHSRENWNPFSLLSVLTNTSTSLQTMNRASTLLRQVATSTSLRQVTTSTSLRQVATSTSLRALTRNLSFLIIAAFILLTGVKVYAQDNVSNFTEFNDYWTGNTVFGATPNISLTGDIIFGPALGAAVAGLNMTIAGNDRIFDGVGTYRGLNLGNSMSVAVNGGITFQNFSNTGNGGAIYASSANISFSGGSTTFQNNNVTNATANGGAIYLIASTMNFTNVYAEFTDNDSRNNGGVIYSSGSNISFNAGTATFQNNISTGSGGAIYLMAGSTMSFTNVYTEFMGNNASGNGGAIYATGASSISFSGGSVIWQDNISENSGANTGGGAIFLSASTISFTNMNMEFAGNEGNYGGAIYTQSASGISFNGGSTTFQNNVSSQSGGAIYALSGSNINFNIGTAIFQNNEALASDGGGGAIYLSASSISFTNMNTEFVDNETTGWATRGAAILAVSGSSISFSGGSVIFTSNSSLGAIRGGGAIALENSIISFTNVYSEFIGNNSDYRGGAISATNSNISFTGGSTTFRDNTGGAISLSGSILNFIDVMNVDFINNTGTGIYATSGSSINFNVENINIEFSSNSSRAIYLSGSTMSFILTSGDIVFDLNRTGGGASDGGGGAICAVSRSSVSFIVTSGNVIFSSNIADGYYASGGAISLVQSTMSFVVTDGNIIFTSNTVVTNYMRAGAIYANASSMSFIVSGGSIVFNLNDSNSYGGAICSALQSMMDFDVTGGVIFSSNTAVSGGAIFLVAGGLIDFSNTLINAQNNRATGSGGFLYIFGSTVAFVDANISNNTANTGGAIYASGGGALFSGSTYDTGGAYISFSGASTTFQNNKSLAATGSGGAMFVSASTICFTNIYTEFTDNSSRNNGGAIYAQSASSISFNSGNLIFQNNISTGSGGGGAIYATGGSGISFSGGSTTFLNNKSLNAAASGGAIYSSGSIISFTNTYTEFTDNNSRNNGGAIYAQSASSISFNSGNLIFQNNISTGSGGGGAIYASGDSSISFNAGTATFQNNIAISSGGAVFLTVSTMSFANMTVDFSSNNAINTGGAIHAQIASNINFNAVNTTFQNNISTGSSGGIHASSGSSIRFIGGVATFQNNTSLTSNGGAIYLTGSTMSFMNTIVEFSSNNATTNGGAIYAMGASIISFSGGSTTFQNNISTGSGGAIYLTASTMSFRNMTVEFINNKSLGSLGGAIYSFGSSNINFSTGTAIFQNNVSTASGGAINLSLTTMSFTNMYTEFIDNNAVVNGGAIFAGDSNISFSGGTTTFQNNISYSGIGGGAIYLTGGASIINFTNTNTTFTGNNARSNGGAIWLQSGSKISFSGGSTTFQNNISTTSGGAIYLLGSTMNISSVYTGFIGNNAAVNGGAIAATGGSIITLDSTHGQILFAGNSATLGNDIYINASSINFHAVNRITISSGIYVGSNDNTINKTGNGELYLSGINYIQGMFSQSSGITTINNSTTTFTNGTLSVINSSGISIINSSVTFSPTVHMTFVSNSKASGGAIFGDALSNVYFNAVSTFMYNKANNHGGALYIQQSTVTFTQAADFILNQALTGHGGAIYMSSNNYVFNGATKFEINQALSGVGLGGAIYANGSTLTFNAASEFNTNEASMGGALYLKNNQTTFSDVTFTGNRAMNGHGGAIYADADPVTINFAGETAFTNNQATLNGGALFLENSSVTFTSSADFESNTATQNGGAMYIGFGTTVNAGNVTFNNNTAVNGLGGAVYMEGVLGNNAELNITQTENTVVSGNKAGPGLISNVFYLEQYSRLNLDIADDITMTVEDAIVSLGNSSNVITKTGEGILELDSNINAINGVLNIFDGIVRTGYATGLGNIIFDNGTLNITKTATLTNNMYALTSGSTIDLDIDGETVTTLTGQIGGGLGTLEKNGLGKIIMSGLSGASISNTLINMGELEVLTNSFISPNVTVGGDTILSGNGTITGNVTNNGLISPGYVSSNPDTQFGTLTINGNYTENGIFALRLHEGYMPINDKLQVNGTAIINDDTLIDLDLRQGFDIYLIYPVLQTTGGLEGIYSGLKTLYPSIDILISTDANNVYLKLAGVDTDYVNIPGGGHNNREVSRIIDNITSGGNPDEINNLSKIIGTMDPLDTAGRIRVLNEMAGSIYANALLMSGHQMRQAYHRILDRRESGYEGYNLWAGIYGSQKKMQEDSNSYDFKARNGYLILGLEKYSENSSFMMGYYGSIGQHDTHQWGDVVDINDYRGGLYAGSFKDKWTIRGELSGGYQQYQGKRQQLLLQSRTESEYDGWNINANVEAFYKILESKIANISPFAGLDGSFIKTSGFREKGLDNAAAVLTVKDNQFEILNAVAGLRAEKEAGILRWYGEIGARYNLRGSKGQFTAKLNNIPEEMNIFGAGNNLLSGKAELGFSADIWKGLEVFAMGSYEKADRFWQVVGETGIGYRFGKTKEERSNNKEQKTEDKVEKFTENAAEKERQARIAALKKKISLTRIEFEFDRSNLTPEARRGVEEVAHSLKELKNLDDSVRIRIEGHTDDEGEMKYNEWLSKNRANSVYKKLLELGIDSGMIEKIGHGKTRPIATNETEEGKAQNRRVEIVVE